MRLCTFRGPGGPRLGEVRGDHVQPLDGRDVRDAIGRPAPPPVGDPVPLRGLELLPPLTPGKVLGVGWNYPDHAREMGGAARTSPLVFSKLVSSLTGPRSPVTRPAYTGELDYEGELAVVIGARARGRGGDPLGHVFGYAAMNDITARDMQRAEPQWVRAKGGDGFGPFGPWVTTADEVPDPQALRVRTWVNGEVRQDASTAGMAFTVADLVSWCAASFTLEPGDVIATGTPPGVGAGRTPPAFLGPGDLVRVEVEGLGALENAIR